MLLQDNAGLVLDGIKRGVPARDAQYDTTGNPLGFSAASGAFTSIIDGVLFRGVRFQTGTTSQNPSPAKIGAILHTGTGPGNGVLAPQGPTPTKNWSPIFTIVLGGAPGVATFTYSPDGGATVTAVLGVPASLFFTDPFTGLLWTFLAGGVFVAADTYATTITAGSTGAAATTINDVTLPHALGRTAEFLVVKPQGTPPIYLSPNDPQISTKPTTTDQRQLIVLTSSGVVTADIWCF